MNTTDPLQLFWTKLKNPIENIQEIIIGEKYTGVMLKNGNLGVCANLNFKPVYKNELDINIIEDRIIINAIINAYINNETIFENSADIIDAIDFCKYSNIVMIGFFESLYQKFIKKGIPLEVFDRLVTDNPAVSDIKKMKSTIEKCDALILTATTIFNKTFNEIISYTSSSCSIFVLGPSSILSRDVQCHYNIKGVFGSVFQPNDNEVLRIIELNGGTKSFMHRMRKVYLL